MRHASNRFAVLIAAALSLGAARSAFAELYAITDLGSLGGAKGSGALALNGHGSSAGYSFVAGTNLVHAMINRYGVVQDLGTLGGTQSLAHAVNSSGDAVGWSYSASIAKPQPVLWRGGQIIDLGTFGGDSGDARDINDAGLVVGSAFNAAVEERAFWWQGGALHEIGTLGGTQSRAYSCNQQGQIVGWAMTEGDYEIHPFVVSPGGALLDLGTLGGPSSHAYDINERGHVCGWSMLEPNRAPSRGWFWEGGDLKNIGTLGGIYSSAYGLNNLDQIVGASTRADEVQVAFLVRGGIMADLNTLLPPASGWFLTRAWDIDDQGAIVGEGTLNGVPRAFLMTPLSTVSAPPSGPGTLRFAGATPNPMPSTGGVFAFSQPAPGPVRLELFDAGGRRLRTVAARDFGAGESRLAWDGRDESGRAQGPGVYWACLTVAGRTLTRAFVVVR